MVTDRSDGKGKRRGSSESANSRSSSDKAGRESMKFRARATTWTSRPLSDFHMIVGLVVLIVAFGLLMVLSSSSVESYVLSGTSYARFWPQCMFAAIGLVLFVAVVRVPTELMRKYSPWLLIFCLILLVLVLIPGIGSEQMGARSWFVVAGISFQPSELAKLALAIWSAATVASFLNARIDVNRALPVIGGTTLLVLILVVLEKDLGTTITIGIIFMSVLWFGLFRLRTFVMLTVGSGVAFLVLALTAGYRSDRIKAYLNPDLDPQGLNFQSTQAKYALANGGIFGRGLGQSDAKWSYLPQAHNDFIFAVIGEELGLIGALIVVALFAAVLVVGLRIAKRSTDPFLKVMTATATTLIVMQAFINIAYVVGLIPVTGLQLPLISAGGTSMITTLLMFGLIAHAAFREPEAVASLESASRGWVPFVFGKPRFGEAKKPKKAPQGRVRERPQQQRRGEQARRSPQQERRRPAQPEPRRSSQPDRRRSVRRDGDDDRQYRGGTRPRRAS